MKAVIIDRFGGPEQLQLRELPKPLPAAGEALVEVESAGVNFGDVMIRSGAAGLPGAENLVLGSEAAGWIAAVGTGVDTALLGQRVFAAPFAVGRITGGYTSHLVLPAEGVFVLPDAIAFDQAVAVGVAGLAALELSKAVPVAGRSVLIHSAAGGVGHLLAQLVAPQAPAHLVASVGDPRKAEALASIGIRSVVSTHSDWVAGFMAMTEGKSPDVIFDAIGGTVSQEGLAALARGGHFVAYGGASGDYAEVSKDAMPAFVMAGQTLVGYSMVPMLSRADTTDILRTHFATLHNLIIDGSLTVHIGHRFSLDEAAGAHRLLESRGSNGKIILKP
ncbi:zinc-binding dehydrogenase [Sphingomonas sp. QA11]|uniref:quinone oxidoreductase family protein n=1 Tax=Sphingomonas sp. QA11 TaxID=2950605 RepID=UPI00234986FA|nr:zinc-binding dehydrogenase [Sphingomonas sp. QA11]WCM27388.1 zinc-binding dehydrogenase [Sphingomonas sp. QA11]